MHRYLTVVLMVGGGLVTLAPLAQAQMTPDEGPWYFQVQAFAVRHDERIPEKRDAAGFRLGLGRPCCKVSSAHTAMELNLFSNPVRSSGSDGDRQTGLMLDGVHFFSEHKIEPYLYAGIGAVHEAIGVETGIYPAIEAGMGVQAPLSASGLALRAEISGNNVFNSEIRNNHSGFLDGRIGLGLTMPFGNRRPVALDNDADDVPDRVDLCLDTPAGSRVDANGCPTTPDLDTDGDGVGNLSDACPGTLQGLSVDKDGCVTAAGTQTVVLKGVNFNTQSSTLTPNARLVLDEAYAALTGQETLKVEIGGHTDANGAAETNQTLSQRRAESVRKYLIGRGIQGERLTAKGYGESVPVADNATVEGRLANRRVELKILN